MASLTPWQRRRLLRVVPDEPGPEFKPGPVPPLSYRQKLARLVARLRERRK